MLEYYFTLKLGRKLEKKEIRNFGILDKICLIYRMLKKMFFTIFTDLKVYYAVTNLKFSLYVEILIDGKRGPIVEIVDELVTCGPDVAHRIVHCHLGRVLSERTLGGILLY